MSLIKSLCATALLAVAFLQVAPAKAETFNTCAGFIDTLPAVITTQGVWCLRKDLATSMTSGNAITVAANNVTIDCNDFKVGGLSAGNTSTAYGIYASYRANTTVRNCAVRGFRVGIHLQNGSGQLVEDNRLDLNLVYGIIAIGENGRVRHNAVYDTGGYPTAASSFGIHAMGDVTDNSVVGVFAMAADSYSMGILLWGDGGEASGNQIRNLVASGNGAATGIRVVGNGVKLTGNHITSLAPVAGRAISSARADTFCLYNTAVNFATAFDGCLISASNFSTPVP